MSTTLCPTRPHPLPPQRASKTVAQLSTAVRKYVADPWLNIEAQSKTIEVILSDLALQGAIRPARGDEGRAALAQAAREITERSLREPGGVDMSAVMQKYNIDSGTIFASRPAKERQANQALLDAFDLEHRHPPAVQAEKFEAVLMEHPDIYAVTGEPHISRDGRFVGRTYERGYYQLSADEKKNLIRGIRTIFREVDCLNLTMEDKEAHYAKALERVRRLGRQHGVNLDALHNADIRNAPKRSYLQALADTRRTHYYNRPLFARNWTRRVFASLTTAAAVIGIGTPVANTAKDVFTPPPTVAQRTASNPGAGQDIFTMDTQAADALRKQAEEQRQQALTHPSTSPSDISDTLKSCGVVQNPDHSFQVVIAHGKTVSDAERCLLEQDPAFQALTGHDKDTLTDISTRLDINAHGQTAGPNAFTYGSANTIPDNTTLRTDTIQADGNVNIAERLTTQKSKLKNVLRDGSLKRLVGKLSKAH